MKCPYCGNSNSKVVDSRIMEDNEAIRRRRQCEDCGERFTTYERIDRIPIFVIKQDGTREIFDRNKVLDGIMKSSNKRPVSFDDIEKIVSEIENEISTYANKEVSSKKIGELVMEKLKKIDEISYVRFASVYKEFKDIDTFMEEISQLITEKKTEE